MTIEEKFIHEFIQTENFCSSKGIIKKMERRPQAGGEKLQILYAIMDLYQEYKKYYDKIPLDNCQNKQKISLDKKDLNNTINQF